MGWQDWLFWGVGDDRFMSAFSLAVAGLSVLLAILLRKVAWTGVSTLAALVASLGMVVLYSIVNGVHSTSAIVVPLLWTWGSMIAFPVAGMIRIAMVARSAFRSGRSE